MSLATLLPEEVDLPHDLNRPLEVQALFDDLPEQLLCLLFRLVQHQSIPDVVCVLHTRQLRDARGAHLREGGREGGRGGGSR